MPTEKGNFHSLYIIGYTHHIYFSLSVRDITINSPTPILTEAPPSLLDISNNNSVYYLYPYQGGMGIPGE